MTKNPLSEKMFLDKFYAVTEVVRTVHVQAGDTSYRIEINKHYTNPKTPFTASYFVKHQVPSPEAKIGAETLDTYLLDTSPPWVAERTPEAALGAALGFLGDRHPKKAAGAAGS
jgi:hypothetical protein